MSNGCNYNCCSKSSSAHVLAQEVADLEEQQKALLEQNRQIEEKKSRILKGEPAESPGHTCLKGFCGLCCLVSIIGLIAVGIYAYKCVQRVLGQESITLPLVHNMTGKLFRLENMSTVPEATWAQLSSKLTDKWSTSTNYTFGYASAEDTPHLLFEGSKVDGIFNLVPEKMRGVWWMKGNPLPEILAVAHYGKWYAKEQILVLPNSPFTWAWWGGTTSEYPADVDMITKLTYTFANPKSIAESYVDPSGINTAISFRFSPCPGGYECQENSSDLTYADLMSHPDGDLSKHGMVYENGYTMEEMNASQVTNPAQRDGALYFRRVEMFCGLLGRGTGYNLTKIIDGNNKPIEPFFSQYLKFMDGKQLFVWAGLPPSASDAPAKTVSLSGHGADSQEARKTSQAESEKEKDSTSSKPKATTGANSEKADG